MLFNPLYTFALLLLATLLVLNIRLSWELIAWVPGAWYTKAANLALLWLLPVLGFYVLYRNLKLNWFSRHKGNGQTMAGDGLLELDTFFNPGARHLMQAKQAQQTEMQRDGEPDDREFDEIRVGNVIPEER